MSFFHVQPTPPNCVPRNKYQLKVVTVQYTVVIIPLSPLLPPSLPSSPSLPPFLLSFLPPLSLSLPPSGVCGSCLGTLEKALSEADYRHLLEAVTDSVHAQSLSFSTELSSNLTRLHYWMASMSTPYRVIVDGLNVSHVASKNFSVVQVSPCLWCCVLVSDGVPYSRGLYVAVLF